MYRIGLTGGIGAGKSEAAERFRELGARVVVADEVARELVKPGSELLTRIAERFGPNVIADGGALDRAELAAIAFSSEGALRALNDLTHPPLVREIIRRCEEVEKGAADGVLLVDAALLVQWDILDLFDLVVVVDAPPEIRIRRLKEEGLSEEQARSRMRAQLTDEKLLAAADVVLDNSGTIPELRKRVDELWAKLRAEHTED